MGDVVKFPGRVDVSQGCEADLAALIANRSLRERLAAAMHIRPEALEQGAAPRSAEQTATWPAPVLFAVGDRVRDKLTNRSGIVTGRSWVPGFDHSTIGTAVRWDGARVGDTLLDSRLIPDRTAAPRFDGLTLRASSLRPAEWWPGKGDATQAGHTDTDPPPPPRAA